MPGATLIPVPTSDPAELARAMRRAAGEDVDLFVDFDWERGPAGRLDLFAAFSRRSGASVRLREAFGIFGGVPVGVYGVPASRAEGFRTFLDVLYVPMPDGSIVVPVCHAPGKLRPGDVRRGMEGLARTCHVITALAFPPDHPDVQARRLMDRDLIAAHC